MLFLAGVLLLAQGDVSDRAQRLLRDLASSTPAVRERAEIEGTAWGEDFAAYLQAVMATADPELKARCEELLRQIELARRARFAGAAARPAKVPSTAGTLKDAAARISALYGYPIALGELDPRTRASFKVDYGTFLQTLEVFCRSVGIWYRWEGDGVELLKEKPPELARVHAGPFAIGASAVTLEDEPGVFLRFDTEWERRVAPGWFEVKIESMTDDRNAPVLLARRAENGLLGEATLTKKLDLRAWEPESHEWTRDEFLLAPASAGATKLASVKGRVTFWFALDTVAVRFDDPKPRSTAPAGPFQARLNFYDFHKDKGLWDAQMEIQLGEIPRETARALYAMLVTRSIRFVDGAGAAHDSGTKGGKGCGGTPANMLQRIHIGRRTDKLGLENPPKAVECDVVTAVWTRSFSFEIKGVRLPRKK